MLVLLLSFLLLAWLLTRFAPRRTVNIFAMQFLVFGIVYPCAAGLDPDRQPLYLDLSALLFLACAAWQLIQKFAGRHLGADSPSPTPAVVGGAG